MSKSSLIFKILLISLLSLDVLFVCFLAPAVFMVLNKTQVFTILHFVVFIVAITINVAYSIYVGVVLSRDKSIRKSKCS